MKRTLEITKDVALVLTQGEFGYQAVLDALPEAKQFTVVTYNISKGDSHLFKLLESLDETIELRVVTNIPSRYNSYFSDAPRRKARKTIDAYLSTLNPSKFASRMQAFFRFDNHCKLIATDAIAYLGSANFSDESSSSLEAGVLIRGQELVRKVVDLIFDEAKTDAHEYGNNAVASAVIRLSSAKAQIKQIRRVIHELFYAESDSDYHRSTEYFNWHQCTADRSDLDAIIDTLEEVEDVMCNLSEGGEVDEAVGEIDLGPFDVIRRLLCTDGHLDAFVRHDPQHFMMATIEGTIYDDYDRACDHAANEEMDERERLAWAAEIDVQEVERALHAQLKELDRIEGVLRDLQLPNPAIDNTKR